MVLFFAAQLLPEAQAAVAVRCYHLIDALRAAGVEVSVLTHSRAPRSSRLFVPMPSNKLPTPVRIVGEALVGVELAVRLVLLTLIGRRPFVVLSSPPYVTCTVAAVACRAIGLRFAWDARDLYPEVLENTGVISRTGRISRALRSLARGVYRAAAFVSTPSDSFREQILRYGIPESRVFVVRNGFDEVSFSPAETQRAGDFVCINHGLLGRMHDIELIIEVARRLSAAEPPVQFRIIGHGPKEYLLRGDLPPNLKYIGPLSYDRIPAALAAADLGLAFIVAGEGADGAFPVKVYECWGAGLPVVITPVSEAGRLATQLGMGIAHGDRDVDSIVEAIRRLATRDTQYVSMQQAVRRERGRFGRRAESRRFATLVVDALRDRE